MRNPIKKRSWGASRSYIKKDTYFAKDKSFVEKYAIV